eukprot:6492799-Amphidinium_carterae.8
MDTSVETGSSGVAVVAASLWAVSVASLQRVAGAVHSGFAVGEPSMPAGWLHSTLPGSLQHRGQVTGWRCIACLRDAGDACQDEHYWYGKAALIQPATSLKSKHGQAARRFAELQHGRAERKRGRPKKNPDMQAGGKRRKVGAGGAWRAFLHEKAAGRRLCDIDIGGLSRAYAALSQEEFDYYDELGKAGRKMKNVCVRNGPNGFANRHL